MHLHVEANLTIFTLYTTFLLLILVGLKYLYLLYYFGEPFIFLMSSIYYVLCSFRCVV
jgi:hypothetical protein